MPKLARSMLLPLALLAALGACSRQDPRDPPVRDAWVALPAVPGRPGAAYFTLRGHGSADRLTRIDSALVRRIELHESMAGGGGMMHMKPLAGIDLPADGEVAAAPGGVHAMLYGVDGAIAPGTALPLRFGFASGRTVEVEAKTVGPGQPKPY